MRVIAGYLGGRKFDSPKGHRTHPMSDKIRGALFNALGDVNDLTVLDAFAGSGALSFEAISRGASKCTALEIDAGAAETVLRNARSLGIDREVQVSRTGASSWLETTAGALLFDLVLCDPPYDDVQLGLLARLAQQVKPGGLLVLSLPPTAVFTPPDYFDELKNKQYGDATLRFYRRTG